ncbi:MAG: ATP synthase F1 subcomplex gamma subunit [Parcubacteria group bacterium GW2011_GWA2_51_10]|nr:MAG: ATP synthase F1 subcomplex gamma subunit [Parcubacteria group bacterium GW2011_GWA2_51_10]
MANLKSIKSKILSYKKTGTVTHAMEAVSAVKMRKSQERALSMRPYARAALRMLGSVSGSIDALRHPLTQERTAGKVGIIIITSDKGLAGSLNSAVMRKTEQFILEANLSSNELAFFCLGKRGYEFALRRGFEVMHQHTNISDGIDEIEFHKITDKVIELQMSGALREVRVAYTDFRSTFEQQAAMHKILPLSQKIMEYIVKEIPPDRGKYAEMAEEINGVQSYTIEPEPEAVLAALLPKLVNVAIFHKLLESKASEHSARMVAMKNATDKAREMTQSLTRTFNKVRQAAITREVSEITSGIEAMR